MTICMNVSRFINLAAIFSLDLESQYSQERHWLQMKEHFQQKHDFMKIENFTEQEHKVRKT